MTMVASAPLVMLKKGARLAPESLAVRMQKKEAPHFEELLFHLRGD
jgi:hypothetical protein